jgi:hypothetical protein
LGVTEPLLQAISKFRTGFEAHGIDISTAVETIAGLDVNKWLADWTKATLYNGLERL